MPSALSSIGGPPPAPNPQPPQQAQGSAPMPVPPMPGPQGPPPGGMPPGGPQGAPQQGQPQAQQQPPPPPSRRQTLTALHHFHRMEKELTGLLKDPACGKSDMRSEVIDGMTRLVSDGIVKPEEAVKQLGDFPERPFSQRQWLQQHVLQFQQAENQVLDHYRIGVMANGGQSDGAEYNPDDHASVMAGLMSHYGRR